MKKVDNKTLLYIIGALLIVSVLINLWFLWNRQYDSSKESLDNMQEPSSERSVQQQVETVQAQPVQESKPSKGTLVLYHMNGCGHCAHMMEDWFRAREELSKQGYDVLDFEASKNPQAVRDAQVRGFPSVRLYVVYPSNNYIEYQGNRSADSLIRFTMSNGKEM